MAYWYSFACQPERSGVWEQRFEVTPGEHGIKMDVKLNVGVSPMSGFGDRKQMLGAVEEIKLFNWPEGVDGRIEVCNAYHSEDAYDVQYKTKFKASPPENLLERPIAYKHVIMGNNREQLTSPMCIDLFIDWLPVVSHSEPDHKLDAESNPDPDLKLKCSDGVHLYLKGDWIDGWSTLLKRYREGNYDQKMSRSADGWFECPDFDSATLRLLFSHGRYKILESYYTFNNRFVDVMRAADYFGANRACGELFAMQTQRLIHKGSTMDNGWEWDCDWESTDPMSVREYLDLWHHAINYNFPEMKLMLARYTHWFIDEMKKDQAIWDEYCKLMARTLVPNSMSVRQYLDLWHHASNHDLPEMKLMLARHTHSFIDELRKDQAIYDEYCKLVAGISEKH